VLDLVEPGLDLVDRPADDLDLLVGIGRRISGFEVLGDEERHPLAAEARRRVEGRELAPAAARQSRLLGQLPPCALQRLLPGFERPGRKLDELPPGRLARLPYERDVALSVDGDDRNCTWMLDDLALVLS